VLSTSELSTPLGISAQNVFPANKKFPSARDNLANSEGRYPVKRFDCNSMEVTFTIRPNSDGIVPVKKQFSNFKSIISVSLPNSVGIGPVYKELPKFKTDKTVISAN